MRYFIGMQMGWAVVPVIALIGVAYMWLADRLLNRSAKAKGAMRHDVPSIAKAA
jgi:hypothetical protein